MKIKNITTLFHFFLFFFVGFVSYSQTNEDTAPFVLYGKLVYNNKPLEAVNIVLSRDGKQIKNYTTTKNGKYSIDLLQNTSNTKSNYIVVFSKPGFVPKTVNINTYMPSSDYDGNPYEFDLTVEMLATKFSNVKFNRPYGKIIWYPDKNGYFLDEQYAKSIEKEEQLLKQDPDKYLQEFEKKQQLLEENNNPNLAIEAKNKELTDKYNAAINKADDAFLQKNYSTAKVAYKEALALKPSEQYPQNKILEADKFIAELYEKDRLVKEKELTDQYNAIITKADKAFLNKDYVTAISSYREAALVKPAETYPGTKIDEIDNLLKKSIVAEKQKQEKVINNKYKIAIAKADVAFSSKKYGEAKVAYQEALSIKPSEQYPKNKIDDINKLIVEIAEKKRLAKEKAELLLKEKANTKTKEELATIKVEMNTKKDNVFVEKKNSTENAVEPVFDGTKIFSATKEKQKLQEEKKKDRKSVV